jgi:hypothetical protein
MTIAMDNQNGWMEGYAESRKFNTGSLYMGGKFVKYRQELNRIFISDKFDVLNILYKGFIADEEGLPYLNEKEVDAIATFIAYSDMFKKALMTRDSASLQLSQLLEQQWRQKCTQARVPIYINQNEMDEILNVSTSWDRKRFGKSFKPPRSCAYYSITDLLLVSYIPTLQKQLQTDHEGDEYVTTDLPTLMRILCLNHLNIV